MKALVFDTGPIISLAMNNLLSILEPLKERFKGEFYITKSVENELIDKPLHGKKFKFEALRVARCIREDILTVIYSDYIEKKTHELLGACNTVFKARNNYLHIVHHAEMSSIIAALELKADSFVVDERTTRLLIENPKRLQHILQKKLETDIAVDYRNLNRVNQITRSIKMIRSTELVTRAFELGTLDSYLPRTRKPRHLLLDSLLWSVKLAGCAISKKEIEEIIKLEAV